MTSSAKSDCQRLLDYLLVFVKGFLEDAGEFYPIGAVMKMKGEMVSMAGYDGREHPPSLDVIQIIRNGFKEGASTEAYKATALAYDVVVSDPDTGAKHDVIAIDLDHREDYSVVVYFRYSINDGILVLQAPTASEGTREVFR